MTENLLSLFQNRGAILEGHFLLSSGLHSPRYLQCALVLMDPSLATRLGQDLANELKPVIGRRVDAVIGPALGGIVVAHEVARALGSRALFTERAGSVMTLRRGFRLEPGEKVVVVEDAITTGRSTREVMDVAKAERAEVVGVGSLVDRSASPPDFSVPLRSLLRLDIPTYSPEACPLCSQGSTPTKPGSRPTPTA